MAGPSSSPEPQQIALEPFAAEGDHVLLAVRATPKASRNAIGAIVELPDGRPALAIRIAAPPVDGAANEALIAFIAKTLGVARSAVTIRSGETGRLKLLRIDGDLAAILTRMRAVIAAT